MRSWLNKDTVRKMSIAECAWLAGFFDGEGSLSMYLSGRNKKFPSWLLRVGNCNFESVEYCRKITGVGSVVDKMPKGVKNPLHNPQKVWLVHSQRNIVSIVKQIYPYSIIKKTKIEKFLDNWKDLDKQS